MRIAGTEMAFPAYLPHQMGIAWDCFQKQSDCRKWPLDSRLHGVNFKISLIAVSDAKKAGRPASLTRLLYALHLSADHLAHGHLAHCIHSLDQGRQQASGIRVAT